MPRVRGIGTLASVHGVADVSTKWVIVLLAFVFVSALGMIVWPDRSITHEPGVLCPDEPDQGVVSDAELWRRGKYAFTPLATFSIRALVLHRKDYSDEGSGIAPVDFAVGWGRMSDQSVIDQFDIAQTNRFYLWQASRLPIPAAEVTCSSTNIHVIPGNEAVRDAIDDVCRGSIVTMSGFLVNVKGSNGFSWGSSLSRTDSGNRACELFWVDDMTIEE